MNNENITTAVRGILQNIDAPGIDRHRHGQTMQRMHKFAQKAKDWRRKLLVVTSSAPKIMHNLHKKRKAGEENC